MYQITNTKCSVQIWILGRNGFVSEHYHDPFKIRKTLKNLIGMNSCNSVCYKKYSAYHNEFLVNGSMQYTQYVCIVYLFLKLKKKKNQIAILFSQNCSKGVSYTI